MSVIVTKPEINLRESNNQNHIDYGIHGKQILEADTIDDVRSLIGADQQNLIINGNFDIWQRGTTFNAATLAHNADRWITAVDNATGATFTTSRESFAVGQQDVPASKYYQRISIPTIGSIGLIERYHRIEDVTITSDRTVNISFYVKAMHDETMTVFLQQNFGAGGSATINYSRSINVTQEWTKITQTFTLDSVSGKTIGSGSYVGIILRSNSPVAGYVSDISSVQLVFGTQDVTPIKRTTGEELIACQRYFQKSYSHNTDPGTIVGSGRILEFPTRNTSDVTFGAQFAQRMRITPTVTLYSRFTGATGNISNGGDKVAAVADLGERGFGRVTITSGLTANEATYHYTADAEL